MRAIKHITQILCLSLAAPCWAALPSQEELGEVEAAWRNACGSRASDRQDWERARAAHQRDLDYAAINAMPAVSDRKARDARIEARFHVAAAESPEVSAKRPELPRHELQTATTFLHEAEATVEWDDREHMQKIEAALSRLAGTLGPWSGCHARAQEHAFERTRSDLQDLLINL